MEPVDLFTRVVCVTEDVALAAVISSYFAEPGRYFCVIEPPRMGRHDASNEIIRIGNLLAQFQPDTVILAGLNQAANTAMKEALPPARIIELPSISDLVKIAHLRPERAELQQSATATGLLEAARARSILSPASSPAPRSTNPDLPSLVVCEKGLGVTEVIAANYAIAIGADLELVSGLNRDESVELQRRLARLLDLEIAERDAEAKSITAQLLAIIGPCRPESRQDITFFTVGTPYGVAVSHCPTSHLSNLFPGTLVPQAIIAEKRAINVHAALVVDPGHFKGSESKEILAELGKRHMHCKALLDQNATVRRVRHAIDYYPYELLFTTSHVGELSGKRWTFRFNSEGKEHIGVMDVAVGFEPVPGTDKVHVMQFKSFVSIDGVARDSEQWSKLPKQLVHDYVLSDPLEDKAIISATDVGRITAAAGLQLYDSALMPMSYLLANGQHPVVFNNGCSSWIYLAERFHFAGARAYLGTLCAVNSLLAAPVAEQFLRLSLSGTRLAEALWKSQSEIFKDATIRPYAMAGCIFSTLRTTDVRQLDFLRTFLARAAERWTEKAKKTTDTGVKRNAQAAARISVEYLSELPLPILPRPQ